MKFRILISQLSWADIGLAAAFEKEGGLMSTLPNFNLRDIAPLLAEHHERVYNEPKIKKWVETRPAQKPRN